MNHNVKTQKPPFWIKKTDTKKLFLNYQSEDAYIHQILNDSQLGYFDDERTAYIHIGRNLADIEDVEFYSNLTITFDPSFEEIIFHHFRVFREGKWIDKLSDAKINILQREEELNKLVYDERQTLSLIFYDIRTGDLFDYSYSRKGTNPAFKNYFGNFEYINSRSDVYLSHIYAAFDLKSHTSLEIRYFNQEEKLTKELLDTHTGYALSTHNLKGLKVPDDAPKWYDPWGRILFSNTPRWKEINDWARKIYTGIYQADEAMEKLIEECRQHSTDKREQIAHALFYVQEQIRYFADGSNLGGIIPINPNKSLQMRFADCKNKVVILKTLLNGLGVESYPVLVSSKEGEILPLQGPNISAFDHMIIQIVCDEKIYWFDPTFSAQAGDLDHISQPDYGYALVLRENENDLRSMKPKKEKASIHTKQSYHLEKREASLEVTTTYTDFHADRMRKQVRGRQIHELQENHLHYYEKKYPEIQLQQPHKVTDDKSANILSIKEHYLLGNAWEYDTKEEEFYITFLCDELQYGFKTPEKNKRTAPFSMVYPAKITEEREILFPYTYTDDISTKKEDNPFFYYEKSEKIDKDKNKLIQNYTYYAKTPLIEAKDISQYIMCTKNIYTNYTIWHKDPYDTSGLRHAIALPQEEHTIYTHAQQLYDLREKEVKLTVKTDYYAHEAHRMRKQTEANKLEKLQEKFTEYYKDRYDNVTRLAPYKIEDNKEKNRLTLIEEYSLGEAWNYDKGSKGYAMEFYNALVGDAFDMPDDTDVDKPYVLVYPSYVVEEREIIFPSIYETFLSNKNEENDFFSYSQKETMDKENKTLTQKYIYKTKVPSVAPDKLKHYQKRADKITTSYVAWEKRDPYDNSTKRKIFDLFYAALFTMGAWIAVKSFIEFISGK